MEPKAMSSTPIQREPAPQATKPSDSFRFSIRGLLLVTAGIAAALALVTQLGVFGLAIVATAAGLTAMWIGQKYGESSGLAIPFGLVCLIGAGFLVLFLGVSETRPAARRSQCRNNLKQIALALHNYHDTYGSFPPAYIADENGRPMHSWRVLILPFLESSDLYSKYRFDEPWDGPNNRLLADRMPRVYRCPSETRTDQPSLMTSYLAVVGPETVWPGDKSRSISDIQDGTSTTLLVVESHNSGIHWMEPRDLHTGQMAREINPLHGQGICSCHPGCAGVVLVDGSVRFLVGDEWTRSDVDALLTVAGGEKSPLD
jgi:hypothetical protein